MTPERVELEIVYLTLASLASSYPGLTTQPRIVYDHDPDSVKGGSFPAVGIKWYSDIPNKLIDQHDEVARTTQDGKEYAWYETGRFSIGCTLALFMTRSDTMPDPMPHLRRWSEYVKSRIIEEVRFPTVGDPVPGQFVRLSPLVSPYEQPGKKLISAIKLSITSTGKYLRPVECKEPSDAVGGPWNVSPNPYLQ